MVDSWKSMNPSFKYCFYNDKDCYLFVYNNYRKYINVYNDMLPIEKADFFRYLVVYHYGGIYADIDTTCFKNIEPLLDQFPDSLITGKEYDTTEGMPEQYLQWFIAAPKRHQALFELIEDIYHNKSNVFCRWLYSLYSDNEKVYNTTGPVEYTKILKRTTSSIAVLEKGILGSYDTKRINRNSYLQHHFCGTWKKNWNRSIDLMNQTIGLDLERD
jgi:mannosyltransferase OCH1-like enzyme